MSKVSRFENGLDAAAGATTRSRAQARRTVSGSLGLMPNSKPERTWVMPSDADAGHLHRA